MLLRRQIGDLTFICNWPLIFKIHSEGKEPKMKTREDRIGELETQFKKMEARNYVTANMSIGRGDTLEAFPMTHLNI